MLPLKEIALKVAVLSMLADKVKAALMDARSDQAAAMKDVGADGVNVELPDGQRVARVSLVAGRASARIADAGDFLKWVVQNHPEEIEIVPAHEQVRPAFVNQLLADACATGQPVDVDTGELIPGIGVTKGEPYISTSQKRPKLIEAAWRDGQINPLDYVELPQIEAP
jgi:hypothetical protein